MPKVLASLFLLVLAITHATSYSALEDARIIAAYRRQQSNLNHALIARKLVHQANWAAVGTISATDVIASYPMVNVISVDDNTLEGKSTGKIHFLLTDLDFTGKDWKKANKVSFLFSDEQNKNCTQKGMDPMEPTCARAMFSGKVREMSPKDNNYTNVVAAFVKRHPAADNWLKAHQFYLCELDIENIFVLDFYGGPHNVAVGDYYKQELN